MTVWQHNKTSIDTTANGDGHGALSLDGGILGIRGEGGTHGIPSVAGDGASKALRGNSATRRAHTGTRRGAHGAPSFDGGIRVVLA